MNPMKNLLVSEAFLVRVLRPFLIIAHHLVSNTLLYQIFILHEDKQPK